MEDLQRTNPNAVLGTLTVHAADALLEAQFAAHLEAISDAAEARIQQSSGALEYNGASAHSFVAHRNLSGQLRDAGDLSQIGESTSSNEAVTMSHFSSRTTAVDTGRATEDSSSFSLSSLNLSGSNSLTDLDSGNFAHEVAGDSISARV